MSSGEPYTGLEFGFVMSAFAVLRAVDMEDEKSLAAFDEMAAAAKKGQTHSYEDLWLKHDRAIVPRVVGLTIGGYLMNWVSGGAQGLAVLDDNVRYGSPIELNDAEDDQNIEFRIIARLLRTGRPLADARNAGKEVAESQASTCAKEAEDLARYLGAHQQPKAAASMACFAVRVFSVYGASPRALRQFALRCMDQGDKRVFLPLTARAKYPPMKTPPVPPNLLGELVMASIREIFLRPLFEAKPDGAIGSPEDLNDNARLMLEDRDFVIHTSCSFQYQHPGKEVVDTKITRVELRFAQPLLRRIDALLAQAPGSGATPYNFLIDLLMQLFVKRAELVHRRDEHQYDWLVLRGATPYRENSFYSDAIVFAKTTGYLLMITIGETEDDIDAWVRYGYIAQAARDMLRRAKSAVV